MHVTGKDAVPVDAPAVARLRANLDALRITLPKSARFIAAAVAPESLATATARDGRETFTWTDTNGRLRRLGDTSLPSVSAEAMVDAFDAGTGNVVLFGIQHGGESVLLLKRLRAHQAVFVIEPEAWRAKAALSLHDFSDAIRSQRLLIFVTDSAWGDARDFLAESRGFLVPERTLAWPWLERGDVRELTDRMSLLQKQTASARDESYRQPSQNAAVMNDASRLFVATNSLDPTSQRWAKQLAGAARVAGWPMFCAVPDSPAMMHPHEIAYRAAALRPTVTILIDAMPSMLAFSMAGDSTIVVVSHTRGLSPNWLQPLPDGSLFAVRTASQQRTAIENGIAPERIVRCLPAADAAIPLKSDFSCEASLSVVCLAEVRRTSAAAVGLHLASHQRLWETAGEWIAAHSDEYHDGMAGDALRHAESRMGIRLQSDDVRAGLIDRIERVLGPSQVTESILQCIRNAGIDAITGITTTESQTSSGVPSIFVWDSTHAYPDERLLNWLASSRPAFVRHIPGQDRPDDWQRLGLSETHLSFFATRAELTALFDRFTADTTPFFEQAARAADHLRTNHTWRHRLDELIGAAKRLPAR